MEARDIISKAAEIRAERARIAAEAVQQREGEETRSRFALAQGWMPRVCQSLNLQSFITPVVRLTDASNVLRYQLCEGVQLGVVLTTGNGDLSIRRFEVTYDGCSIDGASRPDDDNEWLIHFDPDSTAEDRFLQLADVLIATSESAVPANDDS